MGSEDQQSLRKYGGKRNKCSKQTSAVSGMYRIQAVNYFQVTWNCCSWSHWSEFQFNVNPHVSFIVAQRQNLEAKREEVAFTRILP